MGSTTVFILAIMVIFVAFDTRAVRVRPTGPYHFLILSWQWPQALCNTGERVCERPVRNNFTLHGLWPAYKEVGEAPPRAFWLVPPYRRVNGCTTLVPANSSTINIELLATILDDMKIYWPDVTHLYFSIVTVNFWRTEFENHGMCFDLATDPFFYFLVTVHIARQYYYILATLIEAGIFPGDEYILQEIIDAINNKLGKKGTIRCNEDSNGSKQLKEVWLCFNKALELESCLYNTFSCPVDKQQKIWFHSAYTADE